MQVVSFPACLVRDIEVFQAERTGNNVDICKRRSSDKLLGVWFARLIKHHLDRRSAVFVGKQAAGDICLGVEVQDQAAFAAFLAHGCGQPAQVPFADTALAIERRDDARGRGGRVWHALIIVFVQKI